MFGKGSISSKKRRENKGGVWREVLKKKKAQLNKKGSWRQPTTLSSSEQRAVLFDVLSMSKFETEFEMI
jgi:hypothetical protein